MKTQKTLIIVGMSMAMALATGCKNESLSAADRVKNSPEPAFVARDASAQKVVTLEEATKLKENADAAKAKLMESQKTLKEAIKSRDEIKAARDAEGNSVVKEILSSQVDASIIEVQAMEKNVEMAFDLLVAERKILTTAIEGMSEADKAKIGEAEFEFQTAYEEKARLEMALEAQRESTKRAAKQVMKLNERLQIAKENLAKLETAAGQIPQQIIDTERNNVNILEEDVKEADENLTIQMAEQDNLAELVSKYQI